MKIFGMGGLELVIILVVILLIFGPRNLPKLGKAMGKTVSNLRAGMNEGKKKKDAEGESAAADDETAGAGDEGRDGSQPQLEGEVVDVADAEASGAGEAAAEDAPAEDAPAESVEGADEGASSVDEPKKVVKKVVRKKPPTE